MISDLDRQKMRFIETCSSTLERKKNKEAEPKV